MPAKQRVIPGLLVLLSILALAAGATGCALTAGDANEKVVSAFNQVAPLHGYPYAESAECEESDLHFEGATLYDCRVIYSSGGSELWCAARHDASDGYGFTGRGTCREAHERSQPPS
jgi:hypothetical protein